MAGPREDRPAEIAPRLATLRRMGADIGHVAWSRDNPAGGVIVHGGDVGALLVAACRARSYDADDVRNAIGRPKGAAVPLAEADDQTPGGSLSLKP